METKQTMSMTKKLDLQGAKSVAREYLSQSKAYVNLSAEDKARLVCGATIDGDVAKCSYYIPGARPELGRVVLVLAVSRVDSSVKEIDASDF